MTSSYAMVSSAHGRLQQLLIAYTSELMQEVVAELYRKLPIYTHLLLWIDTKKNEKTLLPFLKERQIAFTPYRSLSPNALPGISILSKESPSPFYQNSYWMQDSFLVLQDQKNGSLRFLQPPECAGSGRNPYIGKQLIRSGFQSDYQEVPWLHIQGGNCLAADDFLLLGAYDFKQTAAMLKFSDPAASELKRPELEAYARRKIGELLGYKKIISVGLQGRLSPSDCLPQAPGIYEELNADLPPDAYPTLQPFKHLDLYLSLAGRNPDTDAYRLLLAEVFPLFPTPDARSYARSLNRRLNEVARLLSDLGHFQIIRNPIPLLPQNHFAYYNNCLLEIKAEGQKKVWLPLFASGGQKAQMAQWDQENNQIWQSLGFEVLPLNTLYPFTLKKGAIHCLSKYLSRG